MAAFELWYTVNSLLLTRKQPLEILVKSWILKFNEVEHFCHLLKMNSIRIPILENTYWWLFLYVLEALGFQNTSKWDALFIKQPSYFLLGIFLFKESSKKYTPSFSLPRGNSIIDFHHVFIITFYAVTLQKLFFTSET